MSAVFALLHSTQPSVLYPYPLEWYPFINSSAERASPALVLQHLLLFFPGFPHAGFYSAFLLNGYYLEVYSYPKQIRFWCFRVWLNKLQHTNKSGSALASRDKPTVLCFAIPLFSWVWIHPTTLLWIPIPVYFPFTVPLSFSNAAWFGLVQGTIGRPPPYLGFFHKSGIWAKGSWCTNFL